MLPVSSIIVAGEIDSNVDWSSAVRGNFLGNSLISLGSVTILEGCLTVVDSSVFSSVVEDFSVMRTLVGDIVVVFVVVSFVVSVVAVDQFEVDNEVGSDDTKIEVLVVVVGVVVGVVLVVVVGVVVVVVVGVRLEVSFS